jgi:uncharacterized protein (TIGR02246 family)
MKKVMVCLLWALIPLAALAQQNASVEAEIRALAEKFNTAYATNDADTYFGFYTEDSTLFFFGERQKVAAYSKEWRAAIAAGGGAAKNEMSDLQIQVMPGGETAVATYFVDNETRTEDGGVAPAKAFETDVWQKIDGEWKIISLHYTEI